MAMKQYICEDCGHTYKSGFSVVCPKCQSTNLVEQELSKKKVAPAASTASRAYDKSKIYGVNDNAGSKEFKVVKRTKFEGFNRVLSKQRGFVESQVVIIAAAPGAMKSTICTQIAEDDTLYISTEETVGQVQNRFKRVNPNSGASILCTTDLDEIMSAIEFDPHPFFVLDSPNMIDNGSLSYAALAKVINEVVAISKAKGKTCIIVSQVTKSGDSIIGFKSIEHAVDTTIFCQRGVDDDTILVTTEKNRFNIVGECVFFRHTENGLEEVNTLQSVGEDLSGTILFNYLSGSRRIPTTIMSLIVPTSNKYGERICVGFDVKRLKQLLAVLSFNCNLFDVTSSDVYVSSGNGLNLASGADIACCASLLSSYFDKVVKFDLNDLEGRLALNGSIIGNSRFKHIKDLIKLYRR